MASIRGMYASGWQVLPPWRQPAWAQQYALPPRPGQYNQLSYKVTQTGPPSVPSNAVYDSNARVMGYEMQDDPENQTIGGAEYALPSNPWLRVNWRLKRKKYSKLPFAANWGAIYDQKSGQQLGQLDYPEGADRPVGIPENPGGYQIPPMLVRAQLQKRLRPYLGNGQMFADSLNPFQGMTELPIPPVPAVYRHERQPDEDPYGAMTRPPQAGPTPLQMPGRQKLLQKLRDRQRFVAPMAKVAGPELPAALRSDSTPFGAKPAKPKTGPFQAAGGGY